MRVISPTFIGSFAHYCSQWLVKSMRVKIVLHPNADPYQQYVYGFWHDKQLLPIVSMPKWGYCKNAGFVSTSRDGEMLATWLKLLGYEVIRGSSSKKAISGLVKLVGMLKDGYSVGIAADGPRGPRHEAKTGISFLAHKSGLKVIPLGVALGGKRIFKSWDQYQLPYPFSKGVIYVGEPFVIDDLKNVDEVNLRVAKAINDSEQKAQMILEGKTIKMDFVAAAS